MERNRFLTALLLVALSLTLAHAVPARRGLWRSLKLTDGTQVRAQLIGDEVCHYWQDADGARYVGTDSEDVFQRATDEMLSRRMAKRRSRNSRRVRHRAQQQQSYTGKKRGLVILVDFSNLQFQSQNDNSVFTRLLNERGFSEGNFVGSVKDYFLDQSLGQFELDFDVVGPVTLSQTYGYYGRDVGEEGDDVRPGEMVVEACRLVDSVIDFKQYDWSGDGEVDQVFILYAGYGQADGGSTNTIWPHEWTLDEAMGEALDIDGVTVNTYACGSELDGTGMLAGIGTICHEFSHCLGLPDMYDTRPNGSNFGMGPWDLMDQGSYNGDGFCPAGYTSYEKMVCGWQQPIELTLSRDVTLMAPLSEGGETYIIYNDNWRDEYFLLENRQATGWDSKLYGQGLLVLHVDYDETAWMDNVVNNNPQHQRCTIVHADNSDGWSQRNLKGDTFPYNQNDSLTNSSRPKAELFNANVDGSFLLNKGVTNIRQNADGSVSFAFRGTADDPSGLALPTIDHSSSGQGPAWFSLGGIRLKGDASNMGDGQTYIVKHPRQKGKKVRLTGRR